jgi:hypothetical protein
MGISTGYGKAITSGSVFAFDTADVINSYKGEPTTNYQVGWSPWTAGGINTDVTDTIDQGPIKNAKTWKFEKTGGSNQWNGWEDTYGGIWSGNSGDIWTTSYWYKTTAAAGVTGFGIGNFYTPDWARPYSVSILAQSNGIIADGQWHYNYTTTQFNENYNYAIIVDGPSWGYSTQTGTLYINGLQWEKKSHTTPFAKYTRSATQGLLDLTTRNTIDLSNVSFDANAQITFDGTNDILDTGIALTELPALSNFSLECIVKIDSYPTAATPNGYGNTTKCGVLLGATYYSGTALYWYGNGSGNACTIYAYIRGADGYRTAGAYNLTPGQYHHLVLVNDYTNSAINLYANGVLNGTYAGPTQEYNPGLTPSAGNIGISKAQVDGGGEAVYSYFNGQIPVAKIYKKALTASEVLQNYNAIKSRFNLA